MWNHKNNLFCMENNPFISKFWDPENVRNVMDAYDLGLN